MAPASNPSERIAHGVSNSPLPPSVEAAYYKKCIDLKRRVDEIEANNDKHRASIERHQEAIRKLRLERAWLLETLQREMVGREKEKERIRLGQIDDEDDEEMMEGDGDADEEEEREAGGAGDSDDGDREDGGVASTKKMKTFTQASGRKRKLAGPKASSLAASSPAPSISKRAEASSPAPTNGQGPTSATHTNGNGSSAIKHEDYEGASGPKDDEDHDVDMGGAAGGFTSVNPGSRPGTSGGVPTTRGDAEDQPVEGSN